MEEEIVEKIYPRLEPSAPTPTENEYVTIGTDHKTKHRLSNIRDIQRYLQEQSEQRRCLSKKYKKVNTALYYTNLGLNTVSGLSGIAGVSTLLTVVLLPVSVSLSGVSALCGGLSIITNKINKKLKKKEEKHREIYTLAESKLNTISSLISKALSNDEIDHNEFQLILDEENKFNTLKESLRRKGEEELKELGRNEIRESFKNLMDSNRETKSTS